MATSHDTLLSQIADDDETFNSLIQQLVADRKAYLATVEKIQGSLGQVRQGLHSQPHISSPETTSTLQPPISSQAARPLAEVALAAGLSELPSILNSRQSSPGGRDLEQHDHLRHKSSSLDVDGGSDTTDDEEVFAGSPLPTREFSEDDLIAHLRTHEWDRYSKLILQDLLCNNLDSLSNGVFVKAQEETHCQIDANHEHTDIYEVGTDGCPIRVCTSDPEDCVLATWEALKSTNNDSSRKQAVGRIVVMREPKPSLFAALHLTMNEYFDMDSIYRILIDASTPSIGILHGVRHWDHRRRRSFVFVFKYHTITGSGSNPLPWQQHDPELIYADEGSLTTCSSVVALSSAAPPAYSIHPNSRRRSTIVGHVYDPFAPWHVLALQCFPDWNTSVDTHIHGGNYCNGPDAFLSSVLSEYRDAVTRFKAIQKYIQKRVVRPKRALVDRILRDQLLFETEQFKNTRDYFWASQTLEVVADEIREMIETYQETFTDEFWSGEHKTLFPGTRDRSARYAYWRKKWLHTRKHFGKEIAQLEEIVTALQRLEKQMKSRWEWIFSGTSIKEAKTTVEQGNNIRLLTLVTLFYLPLSYVTSIYGSKSYGLLADSHYHEYVTLWDTDFST